MAQLISEIWSGLRDAGFPEVMLYLPDNSASRCHWDDTTVVGEVRVALLADQDRQIVRILPVDSCVGIGIASPKGTDPSGYKRVVLNRLNGEVEPEPPAVPSQPEPTPTLVPMPPMPAPVVEAPPPPPKVDPLASRFGVAMRAPTPATRPVGAGYGSR
jgi:hypothetical protein